MYCLFVIDRLGISIFMRSDSQGGVRRLTLPWAGLLRSFGALVSCHFEYFMTARSSKE